MARFDPQIELNNLPRFCGFRGELSSEPRCEAELLAENERLKARLARKDEVIAEVTEELIRTKRSVGEP